MFGKNVIRSAEPDPTTLAVQESFYTLQGEGPYSGTPALFIRLAGCNLACHFCDTEFESEAANRRQVTDVLQELLFKFPAKQREFVVLTGGEPLRQNIMGLLDGLFSHGTELVQIETAGTLWVEGLENYVVSSQVDIVCSPKTPRVNPFIATHCTHWKYIVRAGEASLTDGLPRRGTQLSTMDKTAHIYRPASLNMEPPLIRPNGERDSIWLSPCDEYDPEKNAANMETARDLCLEYGYRLSLQIHKIVKVA